MSVQSEERNHQLQDRDKHDKNLHSYRLNNQEKLNSATISSDRNLQRFSTKNLPKAYKSDIQQELHSQELPPVQINESQSDPDLENEVTISHQKRYTKFKMFVCLWGNVIFSAAIQEISLIFWCRFLSSKSNYPIHF